MVSPRESEHLSAYPDARFPSNDNTINFTDDTRAHIEQSLNPRRILWEPHPEQIENSNMFEFLRFLDEKYGSDAPSMERLYDWSVEKPEDFWRSFLRFSNMIYEGDDTAVLTYPPLPDPPGRRPPFGAEGEGKRRMIDAKWFPDVHLNFAENLLQHADKTPDKEAITFWDEGGLQSFRTYRELRQEVMSFSRLLDTCEVQCGDRVAALIPNIPQTISAMLATTARGAIWSSVSPEFGVDSIVDRFAQLEPKILIATNGHRYRGKNHPTLDKMRAILERIPSITNTLVIPSIGTSNPLDINGIRNAILWDPWLIDRNDESLPTFQKLPFNHPVYILFSSGTTGKPKCIVHGAGGTLLNHFKEHRLHTDLKKEDTLFYFTTTNWMMWNWLVSGLGTGSRIVLYDGDPMARDGRILFDLAEKERITIFGTSASFLSETEKRCLHPRETHDLSSIRTILSTGSRLYGSQFDYVYNHVHPTAQLSSISGGTDIIGGFAVGDPTKPVHREELQTRSLGYKVEVFDEQGTPVPCGVQGELVCTAPIPSQPLGFWNDPGDERYLNAYFQRYGPTVWRHGDYAELTPSGGIVIHGRSDNMLKPGGAGGIFPADIYSQMEKIPEVVESVAVGQLVGQNERIILFVALKKGCDLTEDIKSRIRSHIRSGASPRHVPTLILSAPDLPRTRNGKLSELAVKAAVNGTPVQNMDALANPECLAYFQNRPELAV